MRGLTAGVRGRAHDDWLADRHDWPLNGVGEGAGGGRAHVHDHVALWGGHLLGGGAI